MGQTKYSKAEINALMGASIQHHQSGNFAEAESLYRQVLDASPGNFDALHLLGVLAHQAGFHEDAVKYIGKAVRIDKKSPTAFNHLGAAHRALGQLHEAERCYRNALRLKPDFAEAHYNLANMLADIKQLKESAVEYQKAVELKPDYAEAYCNLASVLIDLDLPEDAEKACQQALNNVKDYALAYYNLGNALLKLDRLDESERAYRQSLRIQPDKAETYSNLILAMNYNQHHNISLRLEDAMKYGLMADKKVEKCFAAWQCNPDPACLRVGIVSGDLGNHPVGYFIEGFLAHIDSRRTKLVAYSTKNVADDLTARIKPHFSSWKSLVGLSDKTAAGLIYGDGIHLLLDLSGHTAKNRLPVFAWKPAPVQATWLGYSGTTGVAQIDYILGDSYVTPVDEQGQFVEKIWRLPESYLCFTPPVLSVEVGQLPALTTGCITFGCFNNLAKMNDDVVALWSRVLLAIPNSKLFLRTVQLANPIVLGKTMERFAKHGISPGKLILDGTFTARVELFEAYNRVDISLDPFPYNGTTTSVESLWMGVPVITLRGDRFLSHVGESILHNAGLPAWIAEDEDAYVAKAVRYASDLEALSSFRAGLRQKVLASPVFDAPRFASHFEEALWGMWREYRMKGETSEL